MNKNTAIKVQNLTKTYKLYDKPIDRLKESLHPLKKSYHKDFYALNNVNFEIKKGETVGIIGKNGSGKSTLLKIITGVLTPTSGRVNVNGKISAILELGAGFNPEMTGLENIYLNTSINGMNKQKTDKKIDEIVEFAELDEFIYQPIKTYSSGMKARLAFAVSINVEPDILIVDEALSVGDIRFQQKCFRTMENMKKRGITIILVSHSIPTIERFCDRAIWLNKGILIDNGTTRSVCNNYTSHMIDNSNNKISNNNKIFEKLITDNCLINLNTAGEKKSAVIVKFLILDHKNNVIENLKGGEEVKLIYMINIFEQMHAIIGFTLKNSLGVKIIATNSDLSNNNIYFAEKGKYFIEYTFEVPLLRNGKYTISPAIAKGNQENYLQQHLIHDALIFNISSSEKESFYGGLLRSSSTNIFIKKVEHE